MHAAVDEGKLHSHQSRKASKEAQSSPRLKDTPPACQASEGQTGYYADTAKQRAHQCHHVKCQCDETMSSSRSSSRRSSRRAPKKAAASLPPGVLTGISSLIEGNESLVAKMLAVDDLPDDADAAEVQQRLQTSLVDCMAMNDLSAEILLARFFDASVLAKYCEGRLGVSGKGNEATLAARIARAWAKPNFSPLPPLPAAKGKKAEGAKSKSKRSSSSVENVANDDKIPKKKTKKMQKVASSDET
jgi:hypothetical protein